jgi:phosphatidylethanolamine-binding protein (PEBP) family uncharacterized protein
MIRRSTRRLKRKTRKQRGSGFQVRFGAITMNRAISRKNFPTNIPSINFKGPGLYTLIMWDPDAPAKSWLHWLVINAEEGDVKRGEEIMKYAPPTPPSGIHTYHIAMYSQKGPLELERPTERGYFHHANFVQEYDLIEVAKMEFQVSANS